MIQKKYGRLIYISSTAALRPNPGQGFYAAAKAASEALYKNLGIELGSKGITTTSIRPGYIDCGRGEQYIQKNSSDLVQKIPIGRYLAAQEVAENILFFLSDHAAAYNATEIVLDGGLTATK